MWISRSSLTRKVDDPHKRKNHDLTSATPMFQTRDGLCESFSRHDRKMTKPRMTT